MKKIILFAFMAILLILGVLSCTSDPSASIQLAAGVISSGSDPITVTEARHSFENCGPLTRSIEEESAILSLGNFTPDWSQARISIAGPISSTDVPVHGEFCYYRYFTDEYDRPTFTPIYHKLVVVKMEPSGAISNYLRFYIPDPEHARTHLPEDYDELLNSLPKGDFTGLSIYTSLEGMPVCAARYADGILQEDVFLYDAAHTFEENETALRKMLDQLQVVYSVEQPKTRAEALSEKDDLVEGGGIEEVYVYARRPVNQFRVIYLEPDLARPTISDRWLDEGGILGGGGSGGGGAAGGGGGMTNPLEMKGKDYSSNKHIRIYSDNDRVEVFLDSLRKDCLGEKVIGSIRSKVEIRTGFRKSNTIPSGFRIYDTTIWTEFYIKMGSDLNDFSLLEELFHIHQYNHARNKDEILKRKLNIEIEAKLCWYMYRKKSGTMAGVGKSLREGEGKLAFETLRNCIMAGDTQSTGFRQAYRDAAVALRAMSEKYRDESEYVFSEDEMGMEVLMKMIEDCLEYKNK